MSYLISLTTQDGKQLDFSCKPGQSVLEAAETAGFFLPALCNAGSCGACLGHCVTGHYRMENYNPLLLPPNHQEQGEVLFCRTYPDSDLQLSTFYTSEQIRNSPQVARSAQIIKLEEIAERTVLLVLQLLPDPEQGLAFEFEPGQFVDLEVPQLALKRAYSIANTPNWNGQLDFLIRLQPYGQFSTFLQETAQIGQHLLVEGPFGNFGIQAQTANPCCFVAGGTGLAPFLSILQRMAELKENHPVQLFLGVNNEQEVFYRQELAALQEKIPQLHVEICVWQASENWSGFSGTPADALQAYLANADILPDVFLCGPPLLIKAATEIALSAGIPAERIFSESFA